MSSCCTDGIITEYNTISHAVGWLVPVSRTDGNITDYINFDFDEDKIVFDVGHQSYVYKILTGRKNDFDNGLRPYSSIPVLLFPCCL